MAVDDECVADCIKALLGDRAASASICPSEVARELAPDDEQAWRALMPQVRATAVGLAQAGVLQITRGDRVLLPSNIGGGPIRLRRGSGFTSA